jgi:hypothetical protein
VDKHLISLKTLRKLKKKPRGKKIILPCEGKEVSLMLNPDFEHADEHSALLLRQTNHSLARRFRQEPVGFTLPTFFVSCKTHSARLAFRPPS